ncbi:fatty-acyl-CoA synthase [Arthrobacter stackebrandtii]|uniref:Fatty-acyl-CoA synthase n=1 Tax=Arthrobacter stackebrandtii TaxID=272161 RepID=A0ABS4YZV7_9MICC|nr:AMP-binding protein [Arthrobacter stackebrandtii]MBP2414338.1 fatty-acyl-CoA synthase [Arthrobacter stackebrandtii]PYH01484.1 AMP-binding protein [Arthrobacter stackebrandtii]
MTTEVHESYASGSSPVPLLEETIGTKLTHIAQQFPGREALIDRPSGRRWSYAQLNHDVDTLARGLLAAGLGKGDRVGIWAPNVPEWVLLQYATAKIGAILVNVNPSYRVHELKYAVQQSGMRMIVALPGFKGSDYQGMVEQVHPECPDLAAAAYIGTPSWDALVAGGATQPADAVEQAMAALDANDPINIQYTSGTTGFPKGATLSHRNILNNGYFVTETLGFTEQDKLCVPVPFYHCFGMVMANLGAMTHGAAIVIPAPSFEAAATLRAVEEERCTALYGVPTMFIAELGLPNFADYDLSTLRTGIMAGSPCPVEVMKRTMAEMNMAGVSIAYGMTETSPVSMQTLMDDDVAHRTETVGRVHPHLEVKIVDPGTGETVPCGTPGELCTRGYSVMLGYWNDPEKTAAAIDGERWMHTGDLGVMFDDGYVNIVGRIKDMVIRGGENLYPREIEEFLYQHPDIADVQVIGVPDERYGEELCAWLLMKPGAAALDQAAVAAYCEGRLSRHKVPRYVLVVDEFPMTVTGKVRKMDMRERTMEILGLG